jgi:hypothetical protein
MAISTSASRSRATSGQFSGGFLTDLPFNPDELLAKSAGGVAPKLLLSNGSHEYWGRAGLNLLA